MNPFPFFVFSGFSDMKKLALLLILVLSTVLTQYLCPVLADTKRSAGKSPTVKIISPREGEVVRGKITIQAKVSDPSNVHHLDFYIQEPGAKDRYGWQDYSAPYFWGGDKQMLDTTLFADGPASAAVGCYPKDSRLPMSQDRVHFSIDNGKPKVRILSPKNEANIGADVLIRVDASDPKGIKKKAGIYDVYIYLDGSLWRKLSKRPFQAKLKTYLLSASLHSIRAVVEDSEGLTSTDVVMIKLSSASTSLIKGE